MSDILDANQKPADNSSLPQMAPLEIHPPVEPVPTPIVETVAPNTASLIVAAQEVKQEVIGPPPALKPKKKHTTAMLVGLVLLFGVLGTGVFFVANPETLADLRSRAANGDRWKVSMGCVGTGCVNDVPVNEGNKDPNYVDKYKAGDTLDPDGHVVNNTLDAANCGSGYYSCNGTCCKVGNVTKNDKKKDRKLTIRETPRPTKSPTPTNIPSSTPTSTPPGNTSTPTPTNTPGATSTPTPTTPQIVYAACNQACTVNMDCGGGLVCLDNVCRNATCSESASCSCAAPTPKVPVAGAGPSVLGATTIAFGFLILLLGLAL